MQRSAATPAQPAAPFFSSLFGGGSTTSSNKSQSQTQNPPLSPTSKPQRPTSSGDDNAGGSPRQQKTLQKEQKDRKPSFGRKPSIFSSSASPSKRNVRRVSSTPGAPADGGGLPSTQFFFSDCTTTGPPLPDPSPGTADGFSKMLSRGAVTPISGYTVGMTGTGSVLGSTGPQSELAVVHQHIQETANKRISTLDYLRKAYAPFPLPLSSIFH
jgi:hypothetical protein